MIAGSQGHRRFRPHESRLNECGASEAIVSTHARETCDWSLRKEEGAQTVKARQQQRRERGRLDLGDRSVLSF